MKKWTFAALAFLLLIVTVSPAIAADNTQSLVNSNFPNGEAFIKLDSGGNPVIAFGDTVGVRLLTCLDAQCNNFNNRAIALGHYPSLDLNSSNLPTITYYSSSHINIATCDTPDCTGTITTHQISSPRDDGKYTALALDSNGNPMIAYYSVTDSSLRYLYCVSSVTCSSGLQLGGELDNSAAVGEYVSMKLNSSGFPVISYFDASANDLKLIVCTDVQCNTKVVVTLDSAGNVGSFTSLALDSNDHPVISYNDISNEAMKVVICGDAVCSSGNTSRSFYALGGITASSVSLTNQDFPVASFVDSIGRMYLLTCVDILCDPNALIVRPVFGNVTDTTAIGNAPVAINANNVPYLAYGYTIADPFEQGLNLTIADIIPPTVISITRKSPNPSLGSSVDFLVKFSEPVSSVSSVNFSLTATGLTGTSIGSISGSGSTRTVTVNTGSGNGTLRLDISSTSGIDDYAGNPIPQASFTSGQTYTVYETKSTTFKSIGAQDGWILESTENSGNGGTMNTTDTVLLLGDNAQKKQYRSILSFNTSALPDNAVIVKVTLQVKSAGVVGGGDPISMFGGFRADVKKGTFDAAALQLTDFNAAPGLTVGPISPMAVGAWYELLLTTAKAQINKLATLSGLTQIRLRFNLDDNNNVVANYLKLSSGNAGAASRPKLIVEYYVP